MVRIARIVHRNCSYHVTHRGNHREIIFFDDRGRRSYLQLLRENAGRVGLQIWAYCLMPNHVHLIVFAKRPDALARGIGNAHRRYSRWVNEEMGWTGHLWANRFYSTPLGALHLWAAARYVELNPVRAGFVERAEDYPWSSAAAHALGTCDPLLSKERPFPGLVSNWSAWLLQGIDDPAIDTIRENTSSGRPTL